jgi:hypothetical protein
LSKLAVSNYSHQVLALLRRGPCFAAELPIPFERIADTLTHLNRCIAAAGWRITGRWVNVPGRFFRNKQRCYTLERLT